MVACERCGERAVGYVDSTTGGAYPLWRLHLDEDAASLADYVGRRAPFSARVWADPGEVPCQCECGCRRADQDTVMDPLHGPAFRCRSCGRGQHIAVG